MDKKTKQYTKLTDEERKYLHAKIGILLHHSDVVYDLLEGLMDLYSHLYEKPQSSLVIEENGQILKNHPMPEGQRV